LGKFFQVSRNGVRGLFVEYNLDWIEHFQSLGIRDFYLQYEFYKKDPICQIVNQLRAEPKEKHYIVVPSLGSKWRDEQSLQNLLKSIHQVFPKDRVLDLVTKSTQQANKIKLLEEPKISIEEHPSMFDVVIVCMLGREGTDWCACSRIHNASVESSITLAVQTAGRAFRRYDGKEVVKLFHYVKNFTAPKDITRRELFADRTNALLFSMQCDDFINPIIIPAIPGQDGKDKGVSSRNTLMDVFGDQYQNVQTDLIYGYELMEVKSKENIYALALSICEDYEIVENLEAVRDALVVRLLRNTMESDIPKLMGIDISWLRTECNFDKIKLVDSIYYGSYCGEDWKRIRELLKDKDVLWMENYNDVKRIGIKNIETNNRLYYWVRQMRREQHNTLKKKDAHKTELLNQLDGWSEFMEDFIPQESENNKDELLKMARNGKPRPHCKTKLGSALSNYISKKGDCYDTEIRNVAKDWFVDTAKDNKDELLKMARNGKPRPHCKTKLGSALSNYISKNGGCYDAEFDTEIRNVAKDWFNKVKNHIEVI
jgi:hypothetical protein